MHTKFVFGKLKGRDHYGDIDILKAVCLVQLPQDRAQDMKYVNTLRNLSLAKGNRTA